MSEQAEIKMPQMTARDVADALNSRWPDDQFLKIPEAPDSADRRGRCLDVLVVALWASRGFELDGVEIKVSLSDFRRELKNPEKADWWWRHVHRFWIACPEKLAAKIAAEIPPSWGLLSASAKQLKVVQSAEHHEPEALPQTAIVGLMRASANAGFNALQRARSDGYNEGLERGKRDSREGRIENSLRAEVDRLVQWKQKVIEAAGGDPKSWHWDHSPERLGAWLKVAQTIIPSRMAILAEQAQLNADKFRELSEATNQLAGVSES